MSETFINPILRGNGLANTVLQHVDDSGTSSAVSAVREPPLVCECGHCSDADCAGIYTCTDEQVADLRFCIRAARSQSWPVEMAHDVERRCERADAAVERLAVHARRETQP